MNRDPPNRMLDGDQLREIDRQILQYLDEGRVTPQFCRERLTEDLQQYSRGYVQERLARLQEHGHVDNLRDCALYELVDDPR